MVKQSEEIQNLVFVPSIDPKSREIGEKSWRTDVKDGVGSIHDVLYLNSFYKQKEHELLVEDTLK